MAYRNLIPTAKRLHDLFEYVDGWLFWKNDTKYGKVKAGDRAGYVSQDGYIRIGVEGVTYTAHRLIWRMHNPRGYMPLVIDHEDGNRTNNRITNLRNVSHSENLLNHHREKTPKPRGTGKLRRLLEQ